MSDDERRPGDGAEAKAARFDESTTPCSRYGKESYLGSGRPEGEVALITEAGSDLGRAVAIAFVGGCRCCRFLSQRGRVCQ